jgi:hypothetical protein
VHRRIGDRVAGSRVRDAFAAMLAHDLADDFNDHAEPSFDPDDALDVLIGSVMQHSFVRPFTGRHPGNAYITDAVVSAVST